MIQIKGTSIQDSLDAARRREGERRYDEIIAALEEPFRSVLEGSIIPTRYYSLDAFVAFLETGLRLGGDDEKILIKRTEAVVEAQLTGIYRIFVRLGSPEFVVRRIATIHKTYFQGGSVNVHSATPGAARLRYTGFRKHHRLMEYILVGFYRKALEICGARNIVAEMTVPMGQQPEYCELSLAWR